MPRAVCHDQRVPTALVVDDHPTFRRFARRLLEASGFDVVAEAEDGASAIARARETRPDVVLLDVLLPDANGFDVAEQLAAEPARPIVVLTSSRSVADLGPSLEHTSARGFISKRELTADALAALMGRP